MSAQTKTFRGLTLAEVEAKVRAELGDDAIVVRQREGLTGGVGGFFQRKLFEVEATAGPNGGPVATQPEPQPQPQPEPAAAPVPAPEAEAGPDFLSTLKAALGPELEQSAVEQRLAVDAAAENFIPEGPIETPVAAPAPAPMPGPAADTPAGAALAALFAPDAPKAPVAWPGEPAPLPEPAAFVAPEPEVEVEVLPAPAAAPLPAVRVKDGAVPAHWPAGAGRLQSRLVDRGVSPELTAEVLDEAVTHLLPFSSKNRLKPMVAGALARRIPTQPLRGSGGRVIGFVGPGGAGKTRCVARLAHAYAVNTQVPVRCLTLRSEDGGVELQRLVQPFGVTVHALSDATEARARLESFPEDALVLIDTPGVSPRGEAELRALAAELRQLRLDECHLAVPATMAPDVSRDLVAGTRELGVDALALTHADETERLGPVLELAMESGLPLSYVGRGTMIAGGLRPALAEELAAVLAA